MKLYKHEVNYGFTEVFTKEIEVEEKPKTYKVISGMYYPTVIPKSKIGVLIGSSMISLSSDSRDFLTACIEREECEIAALQKRAEEKHDRVFRLRVMWSGLKSKGKERQE